MLRVVTTVKRPLSKAGARPIKILALDLGTQHIGWATADGGDRPHAARFGTHDIPATGQDIGLLMREVRAFLYQRKSGVDLISYEAPILVKANSWWTVRKMACVSGIVELFGYDNQIEVVEADLGSIRKHFLGMVPRNTDDIKRAIMGRCNSFGWQVRSTHEADALAVLDYTLAVRRVPFNG